MPSASAFAAEMVREPADNFPEDPAEMEVGHAEEVARA